MEKKLYPIKTDLFRFVTFRSPEQIDYKNKNIRFVVHPNITASKINSCPIPSGDDEKPFEDFVKTFPSYPDIKTLREVNPNLFDFAVLAHKRKMSIIEIEEYDKSGIRPLTERKELEVFDALIGEVLSEKSNEVRQGIAQFLNYDECK